MAHVSQNYKANKKTWPRAAMWVIVETAWLRKVIDFIIHNPSLLGRLEVNRLPKNRQKIINDFANSHKVYQLIHILSRPTDKLTCVLYYI
jgi:hypothetical protein